MGREREKKNAESLGAVTHTHTHTQGILKDEKNNRKVLIGALILLVLIIMLVLAIFIDKQVRENLKIDVDIEKVQADTAVADIPILTPESGMITSIDIVQRKTGTGPFDSDDNPGNDSSEDNNVIRSFDQITWTIEANMGINNTENGSEDANIYNAFKGGVIEVKAELPEETANLVKWDLSSMAWAENAVLSEDGRIFTAQYSLSETEITIPGKQTLVFVLKVLGAPNGLSFSPTFSMNLSGNDESEIVSKQDTEIIVSAVPNYNIVLKRNGNLSNKVTVDYGEGDTLRKNVWIWIHDRII